MTYYFCTKGHCGGIFSLKHFTRKVTFTIKIVRSWLNNYLGPRLNPNAGLNEISLTCMCFFSRYIYSHWFKALYYDLSPLLFNSILPHNCTIYIWFINHNNVFWEWAIFSLIDKVLKSCCDISISRVYLHTERKALAYMFCCYLSKQLRRQWQCVPPFKAHKAQSSDRSFISKITGAGSCVMTGTWHSSIMWSLSRGCCHMDGLHC